jgi:hypothetical protein
VKHGRREDKAKNEQKSLHTNLFIGIIARNDNQIRRDALEIND